jgi:metal-responsive CopG/Arc/MetJ family transcriptional regulator
VLAHSEAMEKKDVRIQLVMSPAEVAALDDWRAEQRIWSRSEAIRRLVAEGVNTTKAKKPAKS